MLIANKTDESPHGDLFLTPEVRSESLADGSILLRSAVPLRPHARCIGDWLVQWARRTPDRTFLAERTGTDLPWTTLTYAGALRQARSAGAWMMARGMSAARPLVVLSDNGIAHAVLNLGAMHVGVPVSALSPAYSLVSKDFEKLRGIISLLDPGAIFVADRKMFGPALTAIAGLHTATVIGDSEGDGTTFEDVIATPAGADVDAAFAAVDAETIAKFLFTSGSTGSPKAVINTQRMLTSSQEARAQTWPFLEAPRTDLLILDWLPWSHTFGGNHNFNMVLRNGGSLYIDGGKPVPGQFATSLANLRDVMPTVYFNVPRGFDMLVTALRGDEVLRRRFFEDVKLIFYAGAALPQSVWEALEDLSVETIGSVRPMVCAWGSTETSPLATDCHFQAQRSGNIGIPIPGTALKLVPWGDKFEVRVSGPNVTPGYWKAPQLTANAFDTDGFYLIGDAVAFADPDDAARGLLFDGRIVEDFKLTSGTWVNVGALRVAGISALSPLVQDLVVAGHGGDDVRFLLIPNLAACRMLSGLPEDAAIDAVFSSDGVRSSIANGLAALKANSGGSSTFATCALFLTEVLSIDGGEITDKGYVNQHAVLSRRADDVAELRGEQSRRLIRCANAAPYKR